MVAVLIGMALVYRFFPKREVELELRASYHADDVATHRDQSRPAADAGPA
jgi:hypothetical protein